VSLRTLFVPKSRGIISVLMERRVSLKHAGREGREGASELHESLDHHDSQTNTLIQGWLFCLKYRILAAILKYRRKRQKKLEKLLGENNRHTGRETSLDVSEKTAQIKLIVNSDHLPEITVEKAHSNRETYKSSEDGRKV